MQVVLDRVQRRILSLFLQTSLQRRHQYVVRTGGTLHNVVIKTQICWLQQKSRAAQSLSKLGSQGALRTPSLDLVWIGNRYTSSTLPFTGRIRAGRFLSLGHSCALRAFQGTEGVQSYNYRGTLRETQILDFV